MVKILLSKWLEFMFSIEVRGYLANMGTWDCLVSTSINYSTEVILPKGTSDIFVNEMISYLISYVTWFLCISHC